MEEILGDPAWGHAPAQLPAELRPRFRLDHGAVPRAPQINTPAWVFCVSWCADFAFRVT